MGIRWSKIVILTGDILVYMRRVYQDLHSKIVILTESVASSMI